MIIAIDIDNVICNLQETIVNLFNKCCKTNYTLDDFKHYHLENVLPMKEAIIMKEMYGEPGLYDMVKPITGAQEGLQKLMNSGHQIYLVTDAIPKTYGEKVEWVHHYFPFIDTSHIIAMKHKWLFKCDVMIEDNIRNLISGVHYERICMNYPWNSDVNDYVYNIHRCNNWHEIINIVNKISKEE